MPGEILKVIVSPNYVDLKEVGMVEKVWMITPGA